MHIFCLSGGFSLIELLFVLAVLGICLAAGSVSLAHGLSAQQARGAAQTWQTAVGWAQVGVVWQEGDAELGYGAAGLSLERNGNPMPADLGSVPPSIAITTNLERWRRADGVTVGFGGTFASPDGGGSIYFQSLGSAYRVVVRPESGFTVRSVAEPVP